MGVMTVHLFIYFRVASIKLILNICTAKGRLVSQQSRETLIFGLEALKPLMTSAEFALPMQTIGKHVKSISGPDAIRPFLALAHTYDNAVCTILESVNEEVVFALHY